MPIASASIARDLQLPKSQDYHFLRKEGIRLLQQLSGAIWTDYNAHDPGMTLLEQVCFAITDVSYRTHIDIRNLLFSDDREVRKVSESNALYHASEIYPTGPVTVSDYRILIIDQVKDVNNVWVSPVKNHPLGIEGLYNVTIQVSSDVHSEIEYQRITDEVHKLLAANRNLCEDVHEVKILKPVSITINCTIDTQSEMGGEEVLGEVLYRLHHYFNPAIHFHTFEELIEKGLSLEEIFNIPSFSSGFILPGQLHHKRRELHASKILETISTVKGVRNVSGLVVKKNGIRMGGNSFEIHEDEFALMDAANLSTISLTKAGIPYDYDASIARHLYEVKQDKDKSSYKSGVISTLEEKRSFFPLKEMADFSSVQNTLPGIYGLGRFGLPETADQFRRARAKQLKAYLLQFDVILSCHLVQLQNIRNLFSLDELFAPTYFGKLPVDFPGLDQLLIHADKEGGQSVTGDETLQEVLGRFDNHLDRKNRILDHLLARFGERFLGDNGQVKSLFSFYRLQESIRSQTMEIKANFLKEYKEISRYRSRAFNYLEDAIDTDNIPTFKKRVCYKLNIQNAKQRSLTHAYGNLNLTIRKSKGGEIEKNTVTTPRGANLSYEALSNATKVTFLIKERKTLEYLLLYGSNQNNYRIISADDRTFLVLFQAEENVNPVKVFQADTVETAKEYMERLVAYFEKLSLENEGFHVLEHVLLRPYSDEQYHFDVLDSRGGVLLSTLKTDSFENQKAQSEDVIIAGLKRSNYTRVQQNTGEHTIILKYGKDKKVKSREVYPSEESVVHQISEMIKYFKELQHQPLLIQERIDMKPAKTESFQVGKDFYNNQLSIILPLWIPRFQNEEFALIMGKCLLESLPAHLGANWVWLGIEEMKDFESVHKEWLNQRQMPDVDWIKLDSLSQRLIRFLNPADE
ncbi:MAG: hypothetical protein AAGA66_02620 [Bacteroidota bacterium]